MSAITFPVISGKSIFIYALEQNQEQGLKTAVPKFQAALCICTYVFPAMLNAACLARLEGDLPNPA